MDFISTFTPLNEENNINIILKIQSKRTNNNSNSIDLTRSVLVNTNKMGKDKKSKKKGAGMEKTLAKTEKKIDKAIKKELEEIGEVC